MPQHTVVLLATEGVKNIIFLDVVCGIIKKRWCSWYTDVMCCYLSDSIVEIEGKINGFYCVGKKFLVSEKSVFLFAIFVRLIPNVLPCEIPALKLAVLRLLTNRSRPT